MSIVERIRFICEREGISVAEMERQCGFGRGVIAQALRRGGSGFRADVVASILRRFPGYDPMWLLTGDGSPFPFQFPKSALRGMTLRPHYSVDFLAGFHEGFGEGGGGNVSYDEMICFPAFRTAEFWVDITGHSMEPFIQHGDVIAVRRLEDWQRNIFYGEAYVIVTEQNRTLKRIRKGSSSDTLLLVPENKSYDSQEMEVSMIREVYKILACVRKVF